MARAQLHFRNDHLQWWPVLLLPTIAVMQSRSLPLAAHSMGLAFLSTVPTLLAFRFGLSFVQFALASTVFHSAALHCLISFGIFSLYSSVLALGIINTAVFLLLPLIPPALTKCFTFVEFTIIVQPIVYYLLKILQFHAFLLGLGKHDVNLYSETSIFCLTCYSFLVLALVLSKVPLALHSKSLCYLLILPTFLYGYIWLTLSQEPLTWILNLVQQYPIRIKLFSLWIAILVATGIFAFFHTFLSQNATTTVTRKIFHLSISLVYLLGIQFDPLFLEFASEFILFVFCYIEILRLNHVYLVSSIVSNIFDRFRDEKDSGLLTLTHIYLLVGCSTPLWLASSALNAYEGKLLLASGVVTVGIGDSFASLGGYYFGKHKWRDSSKSYEGTACSFVSQLVALVCLHFAYQSAALASLSLSTIGKFVIISFLSSFVEAFTTHVDNLILPLCQYASILFLF